MPALAMLGGPAYHEGWRDAIASFHSSPAGPHCGCLGRGYNTTSCQHQMGPSAPWRCAKGCPYPTPQALPLNPQPPGLTFSICSPGRCIPKSAGTSMPQFPHGAPCMKGKPSSSLFRKSARTKHFINGMKLVLTSSITCAPTMYPTLEKQQSAGQSLCPCGEYKQVKGRYEDVGSSMIGRAHGGVLTQPGFGGGGIKRKKDQRAGANNLLSFYTTTLRPRGIQVSDR